MKEEEIKKAISMVYASANHTSDSYSKEDWEWFRELIKS